MDLARPSPTHPCRLEKLTKYGGKFTRPWHLFTVNGGVGHPELATKEKGERIVKAIVERLKEVLLELCQTEMNETFPY
jgi:creatinine amidohydrolase/Fe(II)-dependent formamide hydrolase-like protein